MFAESMRPAAFLFDERMARSVAAARAWRARGVTVLDARQFGLADAWRATLPRLLRSNPRLAGLTPWSDRTICEIMCRDLGLRVQSHDEVGDDGLVSWRLA
ncbi:MAG: hypothetical protein ABIT09_12490 [Croceibacterium sp.]